MSKFTDECALGNHEYRPINPIWWECVHCSISHNFEPVKSAPAKEINQLREQVESLRKKIEKYEKVEAIPDDSPFVGSQSVEAIIDLLAQYYPVPVAGRHYAVHLKRQFSKTRAEGFCDACGGLGGIVDCMCGGTGLAKDAVIYLRNEVHRLQDMLLRRGRYEGYQARYAGDCGFCGVCENCKAGRT